jgi:hypothetical protein
MRFAPVNECIYCGSRDGLTDEHIIPAGLGGGDILPRASCKACALDTSKFELRLLRGPLWPARVRFGIGGKRRPSDVPTSFEMHVVRDGASRLERVAASDHLSSIVLPVLAKPGLLRSDWSAGSIDVSGIYVGHIDRTPEQTRKGLGAEDVSVTMRYPVADFARLLAKIAHGYAVAHRGLASVTSKRLVPGILGRELPNVAHQVGDLSRWVGTSEQVALGPSSNDLHAVLIQDFGGYLCAGIQLFILNPVPIHTVIIEDSIPTTANPSSSSDDPPAGPTS